jgi:NAD(P)-dependent dehydrogenase (short-subunit alcohol dehydrogenase family)
MNASSDLQRDRFDLTGMVALVTGGSRGLGREIALGLAQAGANLIVASRNLAACRETAAWITRTTGREADARAVHVGHWDEADSLLHGIIGRFGRLDLLVNNAGMSPKYGRPVDVSEELFDKVVAVNLKGPFRLAVLAGTHMAAHGGGSIINISSAGAVHPRPDILPYSAAKAGINSLTIGLAHAFGPMVRVNAIMPGTFATDVSQHWDPETIERRTRTFALGRVGRPEEIVGAAVYLASSASSYTTGTIIAVDGGHP